MKTDDTSVKTDGTEEGSTTASLFWRPRHPRARLYAGFLASQLYGALHLALMALVATRFDWGVLGRYQEYTQVVLGFSSVLGVPMGMGIVAAYFWLNQAHRKLPWGYMFANFGLTCFGAFFILREGTICLVMVSPLLVLLMSVGLKIGFYVWRKPPFLQVSLLPLLTLLFMADASQPRLYRTSATTTFHSPAPPHKLWPYAANYPVNDQPADWWLWKMGLPMPIQSTGTPVIGGRRDCRFSGNVDVGERIVEAVPNRRLEFIIDRQPKDPEAMNHFIMERGRIELLPDGHGGTILRGTSWYRLQVFPAAYFELWANAIVHQTHHRVFSHMSRLAQE